MPDPGIQVVILAGGQGTRLAEETGVRPKPMVDIGGRPILWHILKHFSFHGFREFVIALGHQGDVIKRYFLEYRNLDGSLSVDLRSGRVTGHDGGGEDWLVHLRETGEATNTGGRVRRLRDRLAQGPFMLTYGDGVSDVDLPALLRFHRACGRIATVTAVRPPARFGSIVFAGDLVTSFAEKPQAGEGWINGGYMVLEPAVLDYLDSDDTNLEAHALARLASENQLAAYRHEGFWQCMDTLRDRRLLESLWEGGRAPWKVWP